MRTALAIAICLWGLASCGDPNDSLEIYNANPVGASDHAITAALDAHGFYWHETITEDAIGKLRVIQANRPSCVRNTPYLRFVSRNGIIVSREVSQ